MLISDKFHLTYCTNIHPGENWELTKDSLEEYIPQIKSKVAAKESFGVGLRLSDKASRELGTEEHLEIFKEWLDANGLYVFTMNGFPYGNFHDEKVKDLVHAPDWTTNERVAYTKRLFDQLAYLIPDKVSGGISTSPISYKHWHTTPDLMQIAYQKGASNITEIILHLLELEQETAKYLHLDIEPEPDGLIENSDEFISFFKDYLIPIATVRLQEKYNIDSKEAKKYIHRYVTICYDVCHFSLAYEEPEETFEKLEKAAIKVGKIQVSSALKITYNEERKAQLWNSLKSFDESTYLHQVTEKIGEEVRTYNDLPTFIQERNEFSEIRVHFHVPIFLEKYEVLSSTQEYIIKVIDYIKKHDVTAHLEIETYTWDVLPGSLKTELSDCVIRELEWLKGKLLS